MSTLLCVNTTQHVLPIRLACRRPTLELTILHNIVVTTIVTLTCGRERTKTGYPGIHASHRRVTGFFMRLKTGEAGLSSDFRHFQACKATLGRAQTGDRPVVDTGMTPVSAQSVPSLKPLKPPWPDPSPVFLDRHRQAAPRNTGPVKATTRRRPSQKHHG